MSMRRHSLVNIAVNGSFRHSERPSGAAAARVLHVSRVSAERIDKGFGRKATCSNLFGASYWLEDHFSGFLLIS